MSQRRFSGHSSSNSFNSPQSNVICDCGKPAVMHTVVKDNPNVGRKFYGCPSYPDTKCKFLKWIDEGKQPWLCELEELRWKVFKKDVTIAEMEYREQQKDEKIKKMQLKKEQMVEQIEHLKQSLSNYVIELRSASKNERNLIIVILISWVFFAIVLFMNKGRL